MSGYNFNQYDTSQGGGIPDQGANGLPLVIASANLPTQAVSEMPVQRGTSLDYSPHTVESQFHTPATTQPVKNVQYARVSADGQRKTQAFTPTTQPKSPSLWKSVVSAVVGGKIAAGSSYSAANNYSTQGSGGAAGLSGIGGPSSSGAGGGTATVGTVTPGGPRTQ